MGGIYMEADDEHAIGLDQAPPIGMGWREL